VKGVQMNSTITTKKIVAEVNATTISNGKSEYTGKKAPVINVDKLKTSKAATNALNRIVVRSAWLKSEGDELMNKFNNSDDPKVKEDNHKAYMKLYDSIQPLTEKKQHVEQRQTIIKEEELKRIKNLEFPQMGL